MESIAKDIFWTMEPFEVAGLPVGRYETVIRLPGRSLFLHSPARLTLVHRQELEYLGVIRWVFIPSLRHTLHYDDYVTVYPNATFIGPPDVIRKLRKPPEKFLPVAEADQALNGLMTFHPLEGMPKLQEVAAFHPASRSLLVGDLVFNVPPVDNGFQRTLLKLAGMDGGVRFARPFRASIKDPAAFCRSLERILDLPIENLIPAHGVLARKMGWEDLADAAEKDLGLKLDRKRLAHISMPTDDRPLEG